MTWTLCCPIRTVDIGQVVVFSGIAKNCYTVAQPEVYFLSVCISFLPSIEIFRQGLLTVKYFPNCGRPLTLNWLLYTSAILCGSPIPGNRLGSVSTHPHCLLCSNNHVCLLHHHLLFSFFKTDLVGVFSHHLSLIQVDYSCRFLQLPK